MTTALERDSKIECLRGLRGVRSYGMDSEPRMRRALYPRAASTQGARG
jgi:hypothetical protein